MSAESTEPYFHFSATLRIHGDGLDFDAITRAMGLRPIHTHKKGASRRPGGHPYRDDAWHYSADLPETAPLDAHLQELWADVAPAREFLLSLKSRYRADVLCAYRSDSDRAGFQVGSKSLAIFTALEIPFGVSVIIA
ncbi:MAG: DUF4279 domain-containing protein [Alphaproteobacteria bacterium]|nr:DUF4279 domain-containing protein [Alphaproteobacteria bacterium]